MSELKPLEWNTAKVGRDMASGAAAAPIVEKAGREAFVWPNPPYAGYPAATPQIDPLPCEILGMNHKRASGRLTFFVPDQNVANVQLPMARTTLALRFDQFRALTLTDTISPTAPTDLAPQSLRSDFRVAMKDSPGIKGETVGHFETEFGLFLFPPADADGGVRRMFIPRAVLTNFEVSAPAATAGTEDGLALEPDSAARPGEPPAEALEEPLAADALAVRPVSSREDLLRELERQATMPIVRIGEALRSLGMVTEAQLSEALTRQQRDRTVPLGETLVRAGVVSRADLQTALARKMGYPMVDLDAFPAEPEAMRKLGYSMAQRLQVMPLLLHDARLVVALDDPVNRRNALDEVEFAAQMKVVAVLGQSRDLDAVLYASYDRIGAIAGGRSSATTELKPIEFQMGETDSLLETLEKEGQDRIVDEDAPIEQSDNSLVRMINRMILEAHKDGVSDIHVESQPGREKIRIRFRKDGLLHTYLELPSNYRNAMIARIKIMCDLDISEKRKPQDGKINFAKFSPQHRIELRVATIPTNNGLEDVVMRILASARPIPLDRLGLSAHNLAQLKIAVERPYGMVLCVGPTGSGKTTTLHSALSHINVPERKIWTAEDPIEITQPGLRQVQINSRIDWTFAKALRAFLRADPDVIMVGEIRDPETAHMAVEASLTGHLVLSTLHTNSAPETVTRLLDMGMDPFNFADSLLAVLAQRLVRRMCENCRTSRPATTEEIEEWLADYMAAFGEGDTPSARQNVLSGWVARHGRDGRLLAHKSPGCERCDKTGFKGRAGLHELMVISREMRRLVQTGARAEALQETALREGMRTLRQDGIEKMLAGQTTIEEVRSTSNS